MTKNILAGIVLKTLLTLVVLETKAVIIRHDVSDENYVAFGQEYNAVVSIRPDGMGTLVGRSWVLTAAHVAMGSMRSGKASVEIGGRNYTVNRAIIHPDWQDMGAHDIGLLELSDEVELVEPVQLYEHGDEAGMIAAIVGSGDYGTGLTGPASMDNVKRGATNLIDSTDREWIYFTFDSGSSATRLEGVSGPGDSGGPAFITREDKTYLAGVSVASLGNVASGHYGIKEIYTRISSHIAWIGDVMNGKRSDRQIDTAFARKGPPTNLTIESTGPKSEGSAIPDTPMGRLIESYLAAYNTGDDSTMARYVAYQYSSEYVKEKGIEGHITTYQSLFRDHFGRLQFDGIVEQGNHSLTFLCSSEHGPIAEFKMTLIESEQLKIGGMQIAIVSID